QQIVNLVKRQRTLNFEPGSEFLYCNTGYTLLAEVVRAVAGESLRQFTTARIFRPLGLAHTFFYDDATEIVPDRAHSSERSPSDGRWRRALLSYDTVGATSLQTTVEDLMKWAHNFSRPIVGDAQLIRQIEARG